MVLNMNLLSSATTNILKCLVELQNQDKWECTELGRFSLNIELHLSLKNNYFSLQNQSNRENAFLKGDFSIRYF